MANLAMTLGIKVIHVAEQDSQVTYPQNHQASSLIPGPLMV